MAEATEEAETQESEENTETKPGEESTETKTGEDGLIDDPLAAEESAEAEEGEEGEESEAGTEKKAKKTIDQRLDEIKTSTWEMREAERNANAATARANTAVENLEAVAAKAGDPKPQEDDYDSNGEFVEALTDWKVKQAGLGAPKKPAANGEAELTPQQQSAKRNHDLRRTGAVSKYRDYAKHEDLVTRVLSHYGNADAINLIIESEQSTDIVQHLGKNPKKLEALASSSQLTTLKEIGKLEDRLEKPGKRTTKTFAPISPGGGGGSSPTKDYAKMSDEEFQNERNKAGY